MKICAMTWGFMIILKKKELWTFLLSIFSENWGIFLKRGLGTNFNEY